jgi:hypothetical protein
LPDLPDKCSLAAFRRGPDAAKLPLAAAVAFTTIALVQFGSKPVPCPATSHQAGSRELSERLKI